MTGTLALFLREVDLTKEQRDILDEAMHRFNYLRNISIPDHPGRKDWDLPQYTYYNPAGGNVSEEYHQIRDAIRAKIGGFFTVIFLNPRIWAAGWVSDPEGDREDE
jgi:hypothetical protein